MFSFAFANRKSDQRWKNDEEVLQVHVLHTPELRSKHIDQHLEVFRPFSEVLGKVVNDVVKLPVGCKRLTIWSWNFPYLSCETDVQLAQCLELLAYDFVSEHEFASVYARMCPYLAAS